MNHRVVITGLGTITSIGIGWREFWDALLAGTSGISPISSFDTAAHFTHNGGEVRGFRAGDFISPDLVPLMSRGTQLALSASMLAVADAAMKPGLLAGPRTGICMGTTMGSVQSVERLDEIVLAGRRDSIAPSDLLQVPGNSMTSAIARHFHAAGPALLFTTACAAGNYAIGCGYDLIRSGEADVVISGGAEPLSRVAFTGFNQFSAVAPERCQPFDMNRKGMMVAEGAGVLVLESLEHARRRNAAVYAEVLGYGLSCDAYHMTTPSVEGVAACMTKALQASGIAPRDVDYISAHGTGTPANDRTECAAIHAVFGGLAETVPVSSVKSMLGHTMGAASAIEAAVCALAVRFDRIPPTINFETPDPECRIDCVPNQSREHPVTIAMNNSYAFGGNNASLIIRKAQELEA